MRGNGIGAGYAKELKVNWTVTGTRAVLPQSFKGTSPSFVVYDIFGKVVGRTSAKNGRIDLKKDCGMPAGIYFLKAR